MAVVSQGWAVDAITTLYPLPHDVGNWNSLQIDYDLVSDIQSGDKITIYINKDDRNHNIQVQYEKPKEVGEGNDWTGIGIDLATETEGEIYSITMTETAAGYFNETTKSKLILTGENYTVTKVTLTHDDTPKQLFPKTVINGWGNISISKDLFTNAVVNDIVKAEFSESVSSAELKFLYGWGSGEEYTITTDETSKIVSLTIASEEILNKLKGNDLLISPRSGNSVSIRDVKIVPTYQLSVSVENGKLYLGDTETEYTNNTRYESGSTVTLRAVANEGYRFVNWKNGDDIVSETASYTTPALSADLTLTANFIQQFTVTAASADTNKGTVAITNADANNKYDAGSTVTVTAAAASDSYEFDKWTKTGDDNWNSSDAATVNPLSISELAADWALTASFKEKTKDTPEINLSAFSAGDDATLNAGVFTTTANSKTISQWIGDNSGVTGNKLVVKFAGTPTGGEGQSVKVAAEYIATEYEEAYAYPDANNIAVVNLDNSKYIKSIYIQLAIPGSVTVNSVALDPLYTITATSANNEQGSVGVTTEPTSDGKYAHGTEVTVTATPQSGYSFLQWKVGETSVSTDASYTFTATEDVALTADFKGVKTLKQASQPMLGENLDTHVTVAKTAFTNATAGDILVINMSETAEGATITLKQNGEGSPASYNYITANYSEALTEGQTAYQVTLTSGILAKLQEQGLYVTGKDFTCGNIALVTNGDVSADAAHVTQYLLTITQPSEGGTIKTGDNDAASKAYTSGTEVSLTATPATNYKFVKWTKDSEDLTETTNPITLTVTANTSIAATFKQMHSVTAISESDAKGTVAVTNPADDNLYDTGSTITVTATPKSGYEFEKWTKTENASWSSTNNPLNIEDLSADWTLTASFTDATFTAPEGETVLSSESTVVVNWGGTSIPTETYNTYKQGDVIKVYVKAVLDNAKVVIQEQQGWTNVTEESIDATTTVYSYTVTASENLAKMNSSGLKITGENYTIWGVTIIPAVIPVKNLSTGSTKINGATSVIIHKEMFANASVGDVITIHISELAPAGENTKAKYGLSGAGENETGDNWGWIEGNDLAENATAITRTITTEDLTILKDAGLKIAGDGIYVCGDVTLTTNGEVPEAQTHSNPSFTLTVNEPIGGTIAIKKDSETVSAGAFDIDTELTLTATASDGYTFLKWQKNGEDAGTDATLSITMSANTEITALFQGAPLEYEEKRTLFEGSVDINWSGVAIQPSTVGAILEAGEQLILTTTVAEGAYGQVEIRSADQAIAGSYIGGLVNGENVITLTSAMVEAMREEFGFWGEKATLTKVVLYKPVTVFSEAGVADLTTMTESEGKSTLAVPHEESLKGNVLVVESTEDATVTVTYTDNTTATNKAGNRKVGTPAASQALVLLDANKYIAKIEVNKAKSVISKIYTATLPVFEADGDNYAADLAMATADAGVLYDTSSFTIAVSSGWKGISLTSTEGETVKGAEISLTFGSEAKVKTTAYYTDGTDTGETGIMSEAATVQKLAIDNTKTIKSISIQPQEAGAVQLKEVKVNAEVDVQKYTLTLSTPENGTVVIKKGNEEVKAGEFDENTELTLTATAAEGYEFTKWQKNGEDAGTEATLTVKMTADMTVTAVFSKKTEPIIDEKTGETDLTEMTPQDPSTTSVEYNDEDQSITITTTEPYKAAQIWFNEPEKLAKGNVLIVDIAESGVNVTVTVKYTDGTESSMTSTAHAASSRHAAAAGTKISVPLETGKDVQNIEVKNAEAGTITIQKMVVTTKNIFTDGVADLSMAKPQSNAIYDTSTYSLAVTKGWTGITISPLANEQVSGVELMLQFTGAAQVKVAVTYNEGEGPSVIMDEAAKYLQMTLDKTKTVKEIQIQPTTAGVIQLKSLAVNQTETENPDPDYLAPLEYGERRTLFESTEGTQLSWNDICQMAANYGAILEEREQIEVYISARVEGCDWPKVFIKDAAGAECGSVLELNSINQFPYMAKFKLNSAMAEQLSNGFSISGDGIIVTKVCLYKPEALKPGDIDIADLNGGYQSSYDATSKTITTTSRWAARGWDIGDGRYNGYDVIVVEFEAVDFPVTLRMEYVDADGATKTLSQGASAGSSQVAVEIPDNIQQINYVYLMYENPGTLILLNADVLTGTYIQTVKTGGNSQWDDGEAWYRLDGKRVSQPGRGIYIHNGKKIVIK